MLIIVERIGKATRNPPRDAMLAHAASEIDDGTAFGIHEALDQTGAMLGPLAVAGVLAFTAGGYRLAFATLAIPAALCVTLVGVARFIYPRPQELAAKPADVHGTGRRDSRQSRSSRLRPSQNSLIRQGNPAMTVSTRLTVSPRVVVSYCRQRRLPDQPEGSLEAA